MTAPDPNSPSPLDGPEKQPPPPERKAPTPGAAGDEAKDVRRAQREEVEHDVADARTASPDDRDEGPLPGTKESKDAGGFEEDRRDARGLPRRGGDDGGVESPGRGAEGTDAGSADGAVRDVERGGAGPAGGEPAGADAAGRSRGVGLDEGKGSEGGDERGV